MLLIYIMDEGFVPCSTDKEILYPEGESRSTHMVPAHYPTIITGRWIGNETCEMDNVLPPDDPWFGTDTYTNCAFYMICISMSKWWGMWFTHRCHTDGGRDDLRWPSLSGHWLSCTGCWLCLLTGSMKWLMRRKRFLHISAYLGCFRPRNIFSKNRIGQVGSDLLYMRFPYYTKDDHQGWSWLSNWFSLRCLGRGWTTSCTFPLYDGPLLDF